MRTKNRSNIRFKVKSISVNRAFTIVLLSSIAALLFVHKEVVLDKTSRNVKNLQSQTSKLQVEIAEAQIILDQMRSFPKISRLASGMSLHPMKTKASVYNSAYSEIPAEFSSQFEIIKSKSGENR